MKKSGVVERDRGWKRIKGAIKEVARGPHTKVGILADSGSDEDGTDMLLIAAANELGTSTIPARPFIRGTFDERQRDLAATQDRLWNLVVLGRIDVKRALGLLGEEHQGQIQDYMEALSTPPNAPRTIEQKGDDNPLIDEGRLKNTVRHEEKNV